MHGPQIREIAILRHADFSFRDKLDRLHRLEQHPIKKMRKSGPGGCNSSAHYLILDPWEMSPFNGFSKDGSWEIGPFRPLAIVSTPRVIGGAVISDENANFPEYVIQASLAHYSE